eukprot:jgi/Botrbrau1/18597/Bobra.0367s0039.1
MYSGLSLLLGVTLELATGCSCQSEEVNKNLTMDRLDPKEKVLAAVAETLLPAFEREADAAAKKGDDALAKTLKLRGDFSPQVVQEIHKAINTNLPRAVKNETNLLLNLLQTRIGTLFLAGPHAFTGSFPFLKAFADLPVSKREKILQYWAYNELPQLRKAFKGFKAITLSNVMSVIDKKGQNPWWDAIGYPGPEKLRPVEPIPEKQHTEDVLLQATLDLSEYEIPTNAVLREVLRKKGFKATVEFCPAGDMVVEADCVVVGSGGGGGVAAGVIAQAGAKVVVIEKGHYIKAKDLPLLEKHAMSTMYERGGTMSTHDLACTVLAGATVGGGTRINWAASFKLPPHVRKEWAEEHGLPDFNGPRFDRAMDAVSDRVGVTTGLKDHSGPNTALLRGLQAIGAHNAEIPRNVGSTQHKCGYCCFGCASGEKNDMTHTYLYDCAVHGGLLLAGATAESILTKPAQLHEVSGKTNPDGNPHHLGGDRYPAPTKVAVGVVAIVSDKNGKKWKVVVKAPLVIAACGAIQTPALMLRSGIKGGGQVGKHLHLHPATAVMGIFDKTSTDFGRNPKEDGKGSIVMWEKGIMTAFSKEVANWESDGYGPLLATPAGHPSLAGVLPWFSGREFKSYLPELGNASPVLIYNRDRDEGYVTIDKDGQPEIHYWPSAFDRNNMMRGVELGLKSNGSCWGPYSGNLAANPDSSLC